MLSPMSHPLDSARHKLARASDHLDSLDAEIREYREGNPYTVSQTYDPDSGYQSFKLTGVPEIPRLRWGGILGDFAHNARSALDHVTWRLAGDHADSSTAFPIVTDPEKWPERRRKTLHHIGSDAQALIEQLQPFQAQTPFHHVLYLLNRLDIEDKHRAIPLLAVNLNEPSIEPTFPPNSEVEWEMELLAGTIGEGAVVARFRTNPPMPELRVKGEFAYDIAFGGSLFTGDPLLFVGETCRFIIRDVEQIIHRFQPFFPADRMASSTG